MSAVAVDRNEMQPAPSHRWRPGRRLSSMLIVGSVLIALAAFYVHFWLYLPEGTGPAGPAVPVAEFAKPWTSRKVTFVGLGDSVTAGFGASRGLSYFDRLAMNPANEFEDMRGRSLAYVLPNMTTKNLALSGSNSLQHLEHVAKRLEKMPDDVFGLVVLTSGGNDLIHWYGQSSPREGAMYGCKLVEAQPWIANYGVRMDAIFTSIEERFPGGCLIFAADIYDPSDGYGNPESVGLPAWPECVAVCAAYNQALAKTAAKHPQVCLVPMRQAFLGHGVHCRKFWLQHYRADDPHYWYASNIEDPNGRGYDAIRRLFLLAMIAERERFATGD